MAAGGEVRVPLIAVVVAVVAVVGLLVGGLQLAGVGDDDSDLLPFIAVTRATQDWLDAWVAGDDAALQEQSGVEAAGPAAADLRAALGGPPTLERVDPPVIAGDRATVAYTASYEVAGIGPWSHAGEVVVARVDGGGWRPVWSPSLLHPSLTEGRRIELSTAWPERASLVLADGRPAAGRVSAALLGRAAPATAEQAAARSPLHREGQLIGQSGLEAAQDARLSGSPTIELRVVEGTTVAEVLARKDGTPSAPARVTIDPAIQARAQAALDSAATDRPSAMVVIRPSTGDVLAAANRPMNGFDRALLGRYPPGSTFKVVTTLALLADGVRPDDVVSCPATAVVGGRGFVNAEGHELGDIPFRRAFAESCNTAFVQLAQRLTPEELAATATSVGFNADAGLGVPTGASSVPLPASSVDLAATSIGQGRVLATPLEMAAVAASVAAGGYRAPRLVDTGPQAPVQPFPPGVAATTAELMRLAVAEGTGTAARLPGTAVAGKTGTAEFGTDRPPRTHAWFVSFRGDLAVAVLVDDGGFGGQVAAPIAADFYRRMG